MDVSSSIRNFLKDALWFVVSITIFYLVITKVRNPLMDYIFTNNTIGKFEDAQLADIKSITISNVPNRDLRAKVAFTISSQDTLSQIFSQLQKSERESYGHPPVDGEYFLVLNLKNKETLSFRVLNIEDRVCVLKLLTDLETQHEIESFRNDSFFGTSNTICSSLNKNAKKNSNQ